VGSAKKRRAAQSPRRSRTMANHKKVTCVNASGCQRMIEF
jgi:hypothetical protein